MNATRMAMLGLVAALAILTAPAALDAAGIDGSTVDPMGNARADPECDAHAEAGALGRKVTVCIKIDD